MNTDPHEIDELEELTRALDEINKDQRTLIADLDQAQREGSNPDTIADLRKRHASILERLISIGTRGAELADENPIVAAAIRSMTHKLQESFDELHGHIDNLDTATPSSDTPDPLEQAAAIIDGALETITKTQRELLNDLLPMIDRSIRDHFSDDDSGARLIGITLGTPQNLESKPSSMGVSVAMFQLREFESSDELVETLIADDSPHELAAILKKEAPELNAIALVLNGTAKQLDKDEQPTGVEHRTKSILIVHPSGLDSYTDIEGNIEHMRHVDATGDAERDRAQLEALMENGRIPMSLLHFYAHLMIALD